MSIPASKVFLAGGTLVVPSGVTVISAEGYGGGGGGGGGATGPVSFTVNPSTGGGGGGGAVFGQRRVTVVPSETLTVVIGAGGAGGSGTFGQAGGVTTITGSSSGLLCQFAGANGANGGIVGSANGSISWGGGPVTIGGVRASPGFSSGVLNTVASAVPAAPGNGGFSAVITGSATQVNSAGGMDQVSAAGNFIGGAQGTQGGFSTNVGGCGGGGGGGGPGGSGTAGGTGGGGSSGGGGVGTAATNASANSGAGGGGGGAGGSGTGGGAGGNGGNGGSGKATIYWAE